jgi:hypothetical protein
VGMRRGDGGVGALPAANNPAPIHHTRSDGSPTGVRPLLAEQLVHHDAKGVDVNGGRDLRPANKQLWEIEGWGSIGGGKGG